MSTCRCSGQIPGQFSEVRHSQIAIELQIHKAFLRQNKPTLRYVMKWTSLPLQQKYKSGCTHDFIRQEKDQTKGRVSNMYSNPDHVRNLLHSHPAVDCIWQCGVLKMHMHTGPKIALHFLRLFVCVSALITCAIVTSCTPLPCDYTCTSVNLMAALNTEEQRQHRRHNVRLRTETPKVSS